MVILPRRSTMPVAAGIVRSLDHLGIQVVFFFLSTAIGYSENLPTSPTSESIANLAPNYITHSTLIVTLAVLGFGTLCLIAQGVLLWRAKADSEAVLRNVTVSLVITLGICALTIGYNQQQIAPITGLFGTIIGFLLGQRISEARTRDKEGAQDEPQGGKNEPQGENHEKA